MSLSRSRVKVFLFKYINYDAMHIYILVLTGALLILDPFYQSEPKALNIPKISALQLDRPDQNSQSMDNWPHQQFSIQ